MILIELLDKLIGLLDLVLLFLTVSAAGTVSLLAFVSLLELTDEDVTSLLALVRLLELTDEDVRSLFTLAVSLANSSIARAVAEATLVLEAIEATESLVVATSGSAKTGKAIVKAILETAIEAKVSTETFFPLRSIGVLVELSEVLRETSFSSNTAKTSERVPKAKVIALSDATEAAIACTELGTGMDAKSFTTTAKSRKSCNRVARDSLTSSGKTSNAVS